MVAGLNERFLLAEDAALKRKFEGLKVTIPRERDVGVWFNWPNKELANVDWPFITITLVDVIKAGHREHSGSPFELDYKPHNFEDTLTGAIVADDWPTPYDLYYTITTWAKDPRHDRQLLTRILGDRALAPHRMGYLEIPEDETVRRLEVISMNDFTGRDSNNDVEYRRALTLRVESELFTSFVEEVLRPGRLVLELTETASGLTETIPTDYNITVE